jgi:hypothetical protein
MIYIIARRTDYYGPRTDYALYDTTDSWPRANKLAAELRASLTHKATGLIELPPNAYSIDAVVMPAYDSPAPAGPSSVRFDCADGTTLWATDEDTAEALTVEDRDTWDEEA